MMRDLLALSGLIVIVLGLALWSVPLAVVAAGAIMFGVAAAMAVANAKRGPDERGDH